MPKDDQTPANTLPDLGVYLSQQGPVPATEIAQRFGGLAEALDRMHVAGLIHGNLRPAALLLDANGNLQLQDSPTDATTQVTAYSAPEQLEGLQRTPQTDIYSLGAVLYHVITGKPHVNGATSSEITASILYREAPRVDDVSAGQPPHVVHAIARALQRDPQRRFHCAGDLIRSIADPLFRAPASSPLLRMLKPKRTQPNVKALWFVIVMAAVVATALFIANGNGP